jgi:hypothetical protein
MFEVYVGGAPVDWQTREAPDWHLRILVFDTHASMLGMLALV